VGAESLVTSIIMRAAVAFILAISMTLAGCFPHDPHKRTIAKITEGGALVAGIGISAFANTGADCDSMNSNPGQDPTNCRSHAQVYSTIGVALILAGLLGFVATVSTAEDEDKTSATTVTVPDDKAAGSGSAAPTTQTTNTTNTQATTPPDTGAGSGAGSADGSGSAAPTPPTPPTP
jgi:hypothetical protein